MSDTRSTSRLFERQGWHLAALFLLLLGVYIIRQMPGLLTGQFWNISTTTWLTVALAVPIIQQVYVWLMWRTQLDSQWLTRRFPRHGFRVYIAIFLVLLAARPITIALLALANHDTLPIGPAIRYSVAVLIVLPSAYLMHSVVRYFGIVRATGADHFDPAYQQMPLVNAGIFRYTSNGMYWFGLLILWLPGVLLASKAALVAALFNHLYIWVHYHCTEKPDIDRIYGTVSD